MPQQPPSALKLIVFDFDGVIVDTFPNVFETYRVMCREMHARIIPQTIEEFRELYGHDTYRELSVRLGMQPEYAGQGDEIFKREMTRRGRRVFDGIVEVIQELSQEYVLVLVSASPMELIDAALEEYSLRPYFRMVIAQSEATPRPKTEGIAMVKAALGISGAEMLAIGDRNVDYEVAVKEGIDRVLLVEYGWNYDRTRYPQAFPIYRPSDIPEAVRRLR